MPAISGVDILLQVNTGTDAAPTYTAVGGQRDVTLNLGVSTIDTTSKDSDGWEEHIPSFKNWGIDFGGLYIQKDTGAKELEDAFFAGTQILVNISMPSGQKYAGKATVESLTITGPYNGEATADGTLKGSGALTPTPAV